METLGAGTVLVVEDEREIRELLRRYLERAGFAVLTTGSGAQALQMLDEHTADIVVLDLGLPDVDGIEVLRAARTGGGVPVVVLTARSEVVDRIRGLRARRGRLRDQAVQPDRGRPARPGGLAPDPRRRRTRRDRRRSGPGGYASTRPATRSSWDGTTLDLTPTEFGLLAALAAMPGRAYSRYELVNRVRGYEFAGYERSIDSHVKNLRHKLGADGAAVVETVHGVGYRLGLRRDR